MNAIRVTARAAARLSAIVQKHDGGGILFSCKSGGCNGFEYRLEPTTRPPEAEAQSLSNGVTLFTCNHSMLYLLGTEIDWSDDIMGARFVFTNPGAASTCGCGATFSP